ncbi:MAG: VWA domain-containing protein [Candidatus Dadabacteria bacterium]|nr:VWA domain-containing protein [Candidatus Dadabacteria bacterium]
MFLDFFLLLKNDGFPVTLKEYLTFLEALDRDVIGYDPTDFYYLSRCVMVKDERHLDRFDRLFAAYFRGAQLADTEQFMQIPLEWLRKNFENVLSEEDKQMIRSMGGLEELMERLREIFEKQKKRHQGGNRWIGTGGTSPYGAYGYNPAGVRIGQDGGRQRRAVKVWDKREFRDLDDSVELNVRNMKMALRKLRVLTREGVGEELDIEKTIDRTSKNAGLLDLEFVPSRKNNVKVLMFFDVGGSMEDHVELCSRLFSAAKHEFKHLEFYYFHNCIYEAVWKNNARRFSEKIPTFSVLNKYNGDYKCVIVGDASMSPWELVYPNGSVEHNNDEPGLLWLNRIKAKYPFTVWLNPVPQDEWRWTESIGMLNDFYEGNMFPLTLSGIKDAILALKRRPGHHGASRLPA